MKRSLFITTILIATCSMGFAQSADEALRYSELRFGGTARGMGVAGAFGAMGADYSSVLTNPGGLGLYRQSELMFTMNFENIATDSRYDGSHSSDDRFNFNIPNVAGVFSGKLKRSDSWKFVNFGIGYNRLANFNADSYYKSSGTDNSILKSYADELYGTPADEIGNYGSYSLESVLAYNAYLINPQFGDNTRYTTVADNSDVNQQISIEKWGGIDELSFALATNYKDKVYFGGSLGIPFLHYRERIRHAEQNVSSESEYFNGFEQYQELNTFGVGVNFKAGVIYRPLDWLRFGAAVHTPTFYGMDDDFSTSLLVSFDTLPPTTLPDPIIGEFHYNLVTPARFIGSLGLIARKVAFFSFDYERVDYGKARYKMDGEYSDFEMGINDDIESLYSSANIYRAGAEFAIKKFRLRGGFAHYDSPYSTNITGDYDGSVNYYTFGAGVRLKKVYFDFAYVRSHSKAVNHSVNDELVNDEITGNKYMVTTGFRF